MTGAEPPSVRAALRAAVLNAMRQRDRQAAAVYRAALAAIDNAEAVPADSGPGAGAIESSALGVGRAEVPRGELDEHAMRDVVHTEIDERRGAAELIEPSDSVAADRLRAEAELLRALLDGLDPR